jgi:hypothetical protein
LQASRPTIDDVVNIYVFSGPPVFVTAVGSILGVDPRWLLDQVRNAARN